MKKSVWLSSRTVIMLSVALGCFEFIACSRISLSGIDLSAKHEPVPPPEIDKSELIEGAGGLDASRSNLMQDAEVNRLNVQLVFTGTAGVIVPEGALVSDGAIRFRTTQDALINRSGRSEPVLALSVHPSRERVPANAIQTMVTRPPSQYRVNVTNPKAAYVEAETPGGETITRTSVNLIFTGNAGFMVRKGFAVSDDKHLYRVSRDITIGETGESRPVVAIATVDGSWTVPPETVRFINTATSNLFQIKVSNPTEGIPGIPVKP